MLCMNSSQLRRRRRRRHWTPISLYFYQNTPTLTIHSPLLHQFLSLLYHNIVFLLPQHHHHLGYGEILLIRLQRLDFGVSMNKRQNGKCGFPLTSLQIGDLQSYRSWLGLFLACESNKFFILVDNRPWLLDLDTRAAHLWQLMVTKSRLSPFANTKARPKGKHLGKRVELKESSLPTATKPKKFMRWFSFINAAAMSRKKALLPVKKLGDSMYFVSELNQILYGFIIFEVAWTNVRGINYLNELQTDTSLAIETKFMKRWEFDGVEHALSCISVWFSGTHHDMFLLRDYLDSLIEEVFYDVQEDFPKTDATAEPADDVCPQKKEDAGIDCNFTANPVTTKHNEDAPHSPPPPNGPYKRRKIIKTMCSGGTAMFEEMQSEVICSPIHADRPLSATTIDSINTMDAIEYRDVLIFFRFNDRDLPFKLKEVIMSDLRLLTLLEFGLPSWVIFLQSYPVLCHLYRPWMCPLVRSLYVLISVVTVIIGFYDLYKNVPVLKAAASRLCGPLFDWIETWEMISRIRYLGTMLFLHNFEKTITVFLMVTRAIRSFVSVLTQPMAGPFVELASFVLPFWDICLQAVDSICSVIWVATESSFSLVVDPVQVLFSPIWFILSFIWDIALTTVSPMAWALWEISYTPIRLLFYLAKLISFILSCTFDFLVEIWLSVSTISRLASASEATVSSYEISIWRSLWDDLFSQVFRAIRSIVNGLVAFFVACNRHRLSIYNHTLEFFQNLSCLTGRSQAPDLNRCRQLHDTQIQLETRKKMHVS